MPQPLLLLHATIQFSVYNSYKSGPTSNASHIDEDFPARRPDPTGTVIFGGIKQCRSFRIAATANESRVSGRKKAFIGKLGLGLRIKRKCLTYSPVKWRLGRLQYSRNHKKSTHHFSIGFHCASHRDFSAFVTMHETLLIECAALGSFRVALDRVLYEHSLYLRRTSTNQAVAY
jgi:hypothetical protein